MAASGLLRWSSPRSSSGSGAPGTDRRNRESRAWISSGRSDADFYVLDEEFGPAFIKICTYGPWFARVWVNGHEWAKRQATKAGIAFTSLSNGFASCDQPGRLQAVCDTFGPEHV